MLIYVAADLSQRAERITDGYLSTTTVFFILRENDFRRARKKNPLGRKSLSRRRNGANKGFRHRGELARPVAAAHRVRAQYYYYIRGVMSDGEAGAR